MSNPRIALVKFTRFSLAHAVMLALSSGSARSRSVVSVFSFVFRPAGPLGGRLFAWLRAFCGFE